MRIVFCIYDKNVLYSYRDDKLSKELAKSNKFEYRVIDNRDQFFTRDFPKLVLRCEVQDMPLIIERSKTFSNQEYQNMDLHPLHRFYPMIQVHCQLHRKDS